MFDLGLDKIVDLLSSKSEAAVTNLLQNIKPTPSNVQSKSQNSVKKLALDSIIRTQPKSRLSEYETKREQKTLQDRKTKLLKQLQSVDHEIQKVKVQHSRVEERKKTYTDYTDPENLKRASDLVARMNQLRKQQSLNNKKQSQKVEQRIQTSLKKFQEMEQLQQKQKNQKRHLIEQRIQQRRNQLKLVREHSKISNSLIKELKNYRISLPNINKYRNPEQTSQIGEMQSTDKSVKKQHSPKNYPKSPFLQKIQQDQANKKREEYIKSYERKKIRERQQNYGKKIRKNLKESSLFVTD